MKNKVFGTITLLFICISLCTILSCSDKEGDSSLNDTNFNDNILIESENLINLPKKKAILRLKREKRKNFNSDMRNSYNEFLNEEKNNDKEKIEKNENNEKEIKEDKIKENEIIENIESDADAKNNDLIDNKNNIEDNNENNNIVDNNIDNNNTNEEKETPKNPNDFLLEGPSNLENINTVEDTKNQDVEFFGDDIKEDTEVFNNTTNENIKKVNNEIEDTKQPSNNNEFLNEHPDEKLEKTDSEDSNQAWWITPKNTKNNYVTKKLPQEQKNQNWWESDGKENNLLMLKNKPNNNNTNWWEGPGIPSNNIPPKRQEEALPWWLDGKNNNDYDQFLKLSDNETSEYDVTLFDLYLGGEQIGLALVNYTDKWFTIPEPNDLLAELKGIKNPSKLKPLLEGQIPNHRNIKGVGDIALERDSFKLLLNVDKSNLTETQLAINKLIENPQNKFSLENRISYYTSGDIDDNNSNNSFSHKTLASYGKRFLLAQGYVNDEDSYEIQELNLGTIVDKYSVKGGFLQNKGNIFSPSLNILGMKVETEEQLFLDSDLTKGSKIEIFVPSTAKVLFYRNGTLIDYQILNYGLQEVDTTRFPQGSYTVDVEIEEYNGRITKETHFFTKSGLLASRERPVYYISAGSGRDKADTIEVPVLEAGFRVRANDFLETENSIFATESISIASSSLRGLWKDYFFDIGASVSNEGDVGYSASLNGTFKDTFFSISWTEIPGDDSFVNKYTGDDKKDTFLYSANYIKNKRRTINGNIQRGFKNLTYGIQGSFTTNTSRDKVRNDDTFDENFFLVTDDSYAVGPFAHIKLMQDAKQSLDFRTNYYFRKKDDSLNAQLLYNRKLDDKFYNNTSLNFDKQAYKSGKLTNNLIYSGLNTNTNEGIDLALDTEATKYDDNDNIPLNNNLRMNYGNPYMYASGNLNNQFYNSSSKTSYGASLQSSMILTEDGFGRIMTPQRSNTMVIINIRDKNLKKGKKSIFAVIINDMKYSEVKANTPTLIALSPYRTYKIRIESTEESDLTEYDNKSKYITLFPGNIGELTWDVKNVFVGIGTLVDKEGNPISHQKIKGVSDYVYTEEDGTFQANMTGEEKLYVKSSKYDCKVELPKYDESDIVVDFGNVVCK